jgi:ribosomal protein S1
MNDMATSKKLNSTKKRVKVKDLPAEEKKMSGKEMKKVKGGMKVTLVDAFVTNATPKK